jgi:Zn-dependent alcohol dehydrogenase
VVVNDLTEDEMRQLAPLGCGLQTGSGAVFNTLGVKEGETVAVFGCGGVGFGAMWAAKIAGASKVIAIDLSDGRLKLAKELGATHTINPKDTPDVIKAIFDITDGNGVENALETTGNDKVLRQCCDAVGALGKVAVIGAGPGSTLHYEVGEFIRKGTRIFGVCMGACVPAMVISLTCVLLTSSISLDLLIIIEMGSSLLIGYPSSSRLRKSRQLSIRCMMEVSLSLFLCGDRPVEDNPPVPRP